MNDESDIEHLARRAALLVISGADIARTDTTEALAFDKATLVEQFGPRLAQHWDRVTYRVEGLAEHYEEINEAVQSVSPRWKVERMAPVDRSILRLGAWELIHGQRGSLEIINHCVDLAKDYGEKDTPAFVNGLLDQLCQDHDIQIA